MLKARYCFRQPSAQWRPWWRGFRDHATKLDEIQGLVPETPPENGRDSDDAARAMFVRGRERERRPADASQTHRPREAEGRVLLGWAAWIRDEGLKTVRELEATQPAPPANP